MRKVIVLATMIFLLCFSALPAFPEQITPTQKGDAKWEMYGANGGFVGTLERTEKGSFKFFNEDGNYLGLILESGTLLPKDASRSYTRITPEEARFYLDVLKAIATIK